MKTFEIMQKVETQKLAIERTRSVLCVALDLLERPGIDEDTLNLVNVADIQLCGILPELKKVIDELHAKLILEMAGERHE